MAALFPCASVTGAPKKRTMQIVAATEVAPRGVYTGAIGGAGPDGRAAWSVAIRTVVADRDRGVASFGVGSGVVADSTAGSEYAECLLKARILDEPPFALVETFALVPGEGFHRLDGHLARLALSARHFGFSLEMRKVEEALRATAVKTVGTGRMRLVVHGDGRVELQATTVRLPAAALAGLGPEIIHETKGDTDVFVAGMGTTGTLMGCSRYFRDNHLKTKVVGIEPDLNHRIQGLKNMEEAIVPKIYDPCLLDKKLICSDETAFNTVRDLALMEGIFCGISSGAALWGAIETAKDMPKGSTIVFLLPDRGDRYLSTEVFRSVCAECPP